MVTPVLILDSREKWRPVPVEESLAKVGYEWHQKDWWTQGAHTRLNFPPDMKPGDFKGLPLVGYHRVAKGGGLHWHQFWTWWMYNPKQYAGRGNHEGDWEMVQLGCVDKAGTKPILMTCSQHSGGEKREYWRVELTPQHEPKVYVARDSHANYFTKHQDVTDVANGGGPWLDNGTEARSIEWREFGPWATWNGKWGNSDNSPGPLTVRRAWVAPHAYHSQARG